MKGLIPNRLIIVGFLAGVIFLTAFAWFFGPKVINQQEDPVTGRTREVTEWLGATIHIRVEENEVSRWADQHSVAGIYPGQYGWSGITTYNRRWLGRTSIGCGGGYGVPLWIFRGDLKLAGSSREETLRLYQTELLENWKQHSSLQPALKEWSHRARGTNSEPPTAAP